MTFNAGSIEYILDVKTGQLTRAEQSVNKFEKKTVSAFSRVASAVTVALAARKVIRYEDSFTKLQNQLRNVTRDTENLTAVTDTLFNVANQTRSSVDATADLYSKLARSTQGLGLTQKEVIDITKTINQSFASSGASAIEAENAIRQLGQGLSAGALRGDEFNSVAEQAPAILRAVAAETGLSVGQLREFAAEGKITTDLLVRSLQNYSGTAEREFNNTKITVEQANQVLDNVFTQFIGTLDQTVDSSEFAANAIIGLSNVITDLTNIIGSGAVVDLLGQQWGLIAKDVTNLTQFIEDEFTDLFNFVGDSSPQISKSLSSAFKNFVPNVKAAIKLAAVEVAAFVDKAGSWGKAIARSLNPFDDFDRFEARAALNKELAASDKARESMILSILKERDADVKSTDITIENTKKRIAGFQKEKIARQEALGEIENIDFGKPEGDSGAGVITNAITFTQAFRAELQEATQDAKNLEQALGKTFGQAGANLIDNFSTEMADVITQQQTLEDGVKSVGRALVSELLSGIIKVGAQMAIQSALGNSLQATNTATTVGSMGAITAAAAPAAAATNAATGGASAAAGLSVMSAAIPAMVGLFSGLALAGSRAHGGPVSGGSMYKMGEQGFEVYRTKAGDVYGVPGKNGDVISNKDLMGGNEISVQVNNYGNDEVQVSRNENGLTIDIVKSAMIDDVNRNGPFMKSLTSKSSIKNKVR